MSLKTVLGSLFGRRGPYALVWREHSSEGTIMKGEPIAGKSDADAISLVRAKFMHGIVDWSFWVLFRPNDTMLTAEQGPRIGKWNGDFARVNSDPHVQSTLQAFRRHNKPVNRPLHKVKLKSRAPKPGPGPEAE